MNDAIKISENHYNYLRELVEENELKTALILFRRRAGLERWYD